MEIDLHALVDEFKDRAEYSSVKFVDREGNKQTETDSCFATISARFQERGHITKEEVREIGRWKVQGGRIDRHLKKNSPEEVEEHTKTAFSAGDDATRIAELSELNGVRVPVGSSILAMWNPEQHGVIDFRALRALPAAKPQLLDQTNYADFAEFLELFRTYGSSPSAYEFYVEHVRELAERNDLLAREIDMALWEYDRTRTQS